MSWFTLILYLGAGCFKVQFIRAVQSFIGAKFFDNWHALRWSPIMLYVMLAGSKISTEYIPATVEFVIETGCGTIM